MFMFIYNAEKSLCVSSGYYSNHIAIARACKCKSVICLGAKKFTVVEIESH